MIRVRVVKDNKHLNTNIYLELITGGNKIVIQLIYEQLFLAQTLIKTQTVFGVFSQWIFHLKTHTQIVFVKILFHRMTILLNICFIYLSPKRTKLLCKISQ